VIAYDYFYRERLPLDSQWSVGWDLFVSSWDDSERVAQVYEMANAARKDWLVHPEYGFTLSNRPVGPSVIDVPAEEDRAMLGYVDALVRDGFDLHATRICVDITGMMRPHLMFLLKLLHQRGVRCLDFVYAEPKTYFGRENTRFNDGDILDVREVIGFQGLNTPTGVEEILIVAPGFDELSLDAVIGDKEGATRVEIFGLPSLQPDMYQLNVLKAYRTDSPQPDTYSPARRFASASDPFAVASELSRTVEHYRRVGEKRFYLSPLATKAQALGFALFYLAECEGTSTSIIYPVTGSYAPRTGKSISGIWRYTVDFNLMDVLVARAVAEGC